MNSRPQSDLTRSKGAPSYRFQGNWKMLLNRDSDVGKHTISLLKSLKRRPSFGVVDPTSSTPFLFIAHPHIHLWKSHLIPTMCWAQYNKFECLSYTLEAQKPCGRYRRAINCWDRLPQSCAQFVGAKRKGTYVRPTLGTFFRGSGRVKAKVAQSSPTLCNSMDYTVLRILLARILEGVAYPFSKGSSQPRDRTQVSCRVRKIPWRRERLPTLVFWPGEFHGLSMESHRVRHNWVTFSVYQTTIINQKNRKLQITEMWKEKYPCYWTPFKIV